MGIISWIVFGALSGWVASIIMKTNAKHGTQLNTVFGALGAMIGGFVMNFFGAAGVIGFDLHSFLVTVLGLVILIGLLNLDKKRLILNFRFSDHMQQCADFLLIPIPIWIFDTTRGINSIGACFITYFTSILGADTARNEKRQLRFGKELMGKCRA